MVSYCKASTATELEQILTLQKANLPKAILDEERKVEGFVTAEHDLDLLTKMNDTWPHIIAKDRDQVVGYALSMHPNFSQALDVLKPMFLQIDKAIRLTPHLDHNYLVMGQICIDKMYRKQGVFRKLYQTMLDNAMLHFSSVMTEVDATNTRSLNAHYGVGFKKLTTYNSKGHKWEVIYLKKA